MDVERLAGKLDLLMPREVGHWLRARDLADADTKALIEKQIVSVAYQRLGDFRPDQHIRREREGQMQERIPWAIGFWRDPGIRDHRFRHPIAFVDSEWDLAERRLVADHLRSGKRATSCMGYSWCRFNCGIDDAEMGDSDFSDGLWLWPEGLAHYVLEHAVRLPEEFLRHVRHEAEHPGRKYKSLGNDQKFCDYDFWVAWSNEHREGQGILRPPHLVRAERYEVARMARTGSAPLLF